VILAAHGKTVDIAWADRRDHISQRILETEDFYERAMLEDCYDRAPPGLVVDAGAHIGNHTLWFAGVMGRRVLAFEPSADSYEQLMVNVETNLLMSRVHAFRAAVGASAGVCEVLEGSPHNTGSRRVAYGSGGVPVVALDELDELPEPVAVIKIDVEGQALAVLHGARRTLEHFRPVVYVESDYDEAAGLLEDLSYDYHGWLGATPVHIFEAA
jgi:FkbM family methyltransferase